MTTPVIHIEDLTMAYLDNPVVWDVDVNFVNNSRTAIIGPNGAGKSTLLKGMLGLMKPISGRVLFWGQPLNQVRQRIAYVPQTESVNWNFPISVLDVVMMGSYGIKPLLSRVNKQDKHNALDALEQMQMHEFASRHIAELSGGQKQRVFVARALSQNADLYILDEPLAGVDKNTELILIDKFKQLQQQGKTIVAVHHDMNTLTHYFDHVLMIDKIIKAHGPCQDVFSKITPMNWMTSHRSDKSC